MQSSAGPKCPLSPATRCARSGFAGPGSRRFGLKPCEDPAGNADKLVGAAQQLSVNNFIYPVMALASTEAKLTLPRSCEQQAAAVKAPAAEHASHLQALDGTKSVLDVDADLVLGPAHRPQATAHFGAAGQLVMATCVMAET
jgi:hypothetical protein